MALYSNGRALDVILQHLMLTCHFIFKKYLLKKIFDEVCFLRHFEEKSVVALSRINFAICRINPREFAGSHNFQGLRSRIEPIRLKCQNKNFGFNPFEYLIEFFPPRGIKRIDGSGDIEIGIGVKPFYKMIPSVVKVILYFRASTKFMRFLISRPPS